MKQITAYKSNDGKIFESSEEAREHERTKPIVDWLRANEMLGYLPDLISKDAIDFALALFVYHYGDIDISDMMMDASKETGIGGLILRRRFCYTLALVTCLLRPQTWLHTHQTTLVTIAIAATTAPPLAPLTRSALTPTPTLASTLIAILGTILGQISTLNL